MGYNIVCRMENSESPPHIPAESDSAKEQLLPPHHWAGLHPRLLMTGDTLNPAKIDLPPVTPESLGSFEGRDYGVFNGASARERKDHWRGKEDDDFDKQKEAWIRETTSVFNKSHKFFQETDKGRKWSKTLAIVGINTDEFTTEDEARQQAEQLYGKYFTTGEKQSNIKQFVKDFVSSPSNTSDNLEAVQWLANIFGGTSSEVIAQLTDAEVKLKTQPQTLVEQANQENRINNLNSDEQRLLTFLWSGRQTTTEKPVEPEPTGPTPRRTRQRRQQPAWQRHDPTQMGDHGSRHLPAGQEIHYERLGRPRVFPEGVNVDQDLNPELIATELKRIYPHQYGALSKQDLAQQIRQEDDSLKQWMRSVGLNDTYLSQIVGKNLEHYEGFLRQQYQLDLPAVRPLRLVIFRGKTAQLLNPQGALAFVNPKFSVIFLDMGVMEQLARQIGRQELRAMTKDQIGGLVERLLMETNPHELTHLSAELTFWQLQHQGRTIDRRPGRIGLMTTKPVPPYFTPEENLTIKERGRGLMEAVTVELTNQWVKSFNARLDNPAYSEERVVLHKLISLIAQEQQITPHEAFKYFVNGYFTRHGFRHLNETLAPRNTRPYFMQIIYATMNYEAEKAKNQNRFPDYGLTLSVIQNKGQVENLTNVEKAAMREIIQRSILENDQAISLSPAAIKHLAEKLRLQLPRAA